MVQSPGRRVGVAVALAACGAWVALAPESGAFAAAPRRAAAAAAAAARAELQRTGGRREFVSEPAGASNEQGMTFGRQLQAFSMASLVGLVAAFIGVGVFEQPAAAENAGVRSKIMSGGASSSTKDALGSGKNMTRGIILNDANFSGKDLTGVSFQQSIVRYGKFVNGKLFGASFFDADLEGADFTGAELTQVNLELARCTKTIFDNAIATEMYVNGTTQMEPASIEGADFTDTPFRKDQKNYLCKIAKGTNPVTKVDTRESLMCPE